MSDVSSLRDTIVPKSDQLNADDLLAGPITVSILSVKRGETVEQPIIIEIGDSRQPYKPCKSMRRVMISAWGDDGRTWVGQSMTLYADPEVKFGGVKVGGIRISHMSGIQGKVGVMLTTTRSKRAEFVVRELATFNAAPYIKAINEATDIALLQAEFGTAQAAAKAAKDTAALDQIVSAKDSRKKALQNTVIEQGGGTMTYAEVASALEAAKDRDALDAAMDLIQYVVDPKQRNELGGIVKRRLIDG